LNSPFFYGEFELLVDDEKSRISCPSEVRRAINPEIHGTGFFLIVGSNRVPWLYPERYYEALVSQTTPTDITPSDVQLDYARLKFAMAERVEPDKQGRMVMPDKMLKRTGISKEVTLIGVRDHLELWDRQKWTSERDRLFSQSSEIEQKMKANRQPA
jgi:MraZ protein